MVDDRNKTEITKDVTAAAAFWLEEHGFKPIETEVHVADAWVADLAAVIVPTRTELVALKLLKRHPHYLSPAYETWDAHASELTRRMTCIVEVKTTLADFRSDQNHKWSTKPPSALAFLAVPAGLIQPDQWPSGWGILECSGEKTCYVRPPEIHKTDLKTDIEIVCAIATRRDHFTRYQRSRDLQRKERITSGEKKMVQRFDQIARAAVSILYGQYENVESALSANGIKLAKLTARTTTQFQQLWNLRTGSIAEFVGEGAVEKTRRLEIPQEGRDFHFSHRACGEGIEQPGRTGRNEEPLNSSSTV